MPSLPHASGRSLLPGAPPLRAGLAALLVAALATPSDALAADSSHRQGDDVEITGRITSPGGGPLAGLEVRLEAARGALSLRRLGKVETHATHVATTSGDDGGYTLRWSWHDFYDHFEVLVGMKGRDAEGTRFREVARTDVTRRLLQGSPAVAPFEIEVDAELARYVAFVGSLDTDEQRRVFEQMGLPDRIDRLDLPRHVEVTWWYFRAGKAYRFADGRLEQLLPFEPVASF